MEIALVDIDSHNFPNLVLMKLSAWHKVKGDNVSLISPDDVIQQSLFSLPYDKAYGACVFDWNKVKAMELEHLGVKVAGSGTGKPDTLPDEIEHIYPDYSLYGITDTAYGFLTRGCPRQCPFCIVAGKEGAKSRKVADLSEWWQGQKNIKLLDPNLLACNEAMPLLGQLKESGAWVDFTQGLDARLLTDSIINTLAQIKIKTLHFAWDNPRDDKCKEALKQFAAKAITHKTDYVKYKVYVLTNYWSTIEQDLYRVYWLKENGFDPYIMIYNKDKAPKKIRHLQRWVNNKIIFRSCDKFEDYLVGRC